MTFVVEVVESYGKKKVVGSYETLGACEREKLVEVDENEKFVGSYEKEKLVFGHRMKSVMVAGEG